jgi:predicted amidophosphoribosyltransferase
MIRIFAYEEGKIGFHCEGCELTYTKDISKDITNNCALDIEVICKECGETGVLYFIRCTEEYIKPQFLHTLYISLLYLMHSYS